MCIIIQKKSTGFISVEIRNLSDKVIIEMITKKMIRNIIKKNFFRRFNRWRREAITFWYYKII